MIIGSFVVNKKEIKILQLRIFLLIHMYWMYKTWFTQTHSDHHNDVSIKILACLHDCNDLLLCCWLFWKISWIYWIRNGASFFMVDWWWIWIWSEQSCLSIRPGFVLSNKYYLSQFSRLVFTFPHLVASAWEKVQDIDLKDVERKVSE